MTHGYCLSFEDLVSDDIREEISQQRRMFLGGSRSDGGTLRTLLEGEDTVDFVSRRALCILSRWPFADFFKRCVCVWRCACARVLC